MGTIGSRRLAEDDRAELCARVDFASMLAELGFELRQHGDHLVTAARSERTPSCHVWPPGQGRHGGQGWTWHDFGTGDGGDALGFLADVAGMSFVDAVAELVNRTGYVPLGWGNDGEVSRRPAPRVAVQMPPQPVLPFAKQREAVATFWQLVTDRPGAEAAGLDYLASRGIGARVANRFGGACKVGAHDLHAIAEQMQRLADPSLFVAAGLAKDDHRGFRCAWWDVTVLLASFDRTRTSPLFVIGRRLQDDGPKYVNQSTASGARRVPYGLPAVAEASRIGERLLLVEGPIDALGAAELGWHGLAMLTRLRAGASMQQLLPDSVLMDVARCAEVLVVPDNDVGDKGGEGRILAAEVVGWLRQRGIAAKVVGLPELGLGDCNDLGEAAAMRGRMQR